MDELCLTYLISHDEEIRFWEATGFPLHTLCVFAVSLPQILNLNGITNYSKASVKIESVSANNLSLVMVNR